MRKVYGLALCLVMLLTAFTLTGCPANGGEHGAFDNEGFASFGDVLAAAKEDKKPILLFLSEAS